MMLEEKSTNQRVSKKQGGNSARPKVKFKYKPKFLTEQKLLIENLYSFFPTK